jgi:hypothetical protein
MSPARFAAALLAALALAAADPPVSPIRNGHAHNDYEHTRPLFDALDQGFCSVEADVFLVNGQLLVGHTRADLRPERTLEKLYLDPLRERARANRGRVYPDGPPFWLLIDVKTEAKPTYAAVHEVLARYADLFSTVTDGRSEPKAVTAVISGNVDREGITGQKVRYAGIDGRAGDLSSDVPAHLMPWVSERWGAHFRWQGNGPMPAEERAKLREFVGKAHAHGRLVRFWATAEKPEVWAELRSDGVDLINTDKLAELRNFLVEYPSHKP